MKRVSIALFSLLLVLGLTACGGDKNASSEPQSMPEDTASVDNGGMGLYDNISVFSDTATESVGSEEDIESESTESVNSEEADSEQTTTESEDTSSETESEDTSSKKTESNGESSKKTESKDTSSKKKNSQVVKPSTINNPTGIESSGRKNNSGQGWEMTLVNPWNTLNKNYSVDLSLLDSRFGEGKYFDSRAIGHLEDMCEAAADDGVTLWVISAHRTYDYQQMLFDAEMAEYKSYHPGCSESEAEIGAATEVARPGTSEHNLGLAVDFNSVEQSFENSAQYKWLSKHADEYGFIMRYAADKQDITGVIYEPWHYRYVGKENAKKIKASGLSLEEYLKNN